MLGKVAKEAMRIYQDSKRQGETPTTSMEKTRDRVRTRAGESAKNQE